MNNNNTHNEDFFSDKEIPKATGFNAPNNYFDSLEDALFAKISEEQLPEKTGFKTPDDYFSTLEDQIFEKITPKKETKVIPLFKRIKKMIPTVAAASVLLFVSIYAYNSIGTKKHYTEPELADIENWFDESFSFEFHSNDIAIVFEEQDFSEIDFSLSVNDESIEDYLDHIDDTTLFEEFQ